MKKLIVILALVCLPTFAHAQIPVIDSANLGQNVLQVVNIVKQLQDMIKQGTSVSGIWAQVLPNLERYALQLCQGQAVAYCDPQLIAVFRQHYPGFVPYGQDWGSTYQGNTQAVLDTLGNAIQVAQRQADQFAAQDARLQGMSTKSEIAIGRMQVEQAGNMIAAEQVRQSMETRQVMLTLVNAISVVEAEKKNQEAQITAMERKFLIDNMPTTWPVYGQYGHGYVMPKK